MSSLSFTTPDMTQLFYDFDAFSSVVDPDHLMDGVLAERRATRPVESGAEPLLFYFTGKISIANVATELGTIAVDHRPTYTSGSPRGFKVKNRIVLSLNPPSALTFKEAMHQVYVLAQFLSAAAGRCQEPTRISLQLAGDRADLPRFVEVQKCLPFLGRSHNRLNKPHPSDLPLKPIERPAEFATVLADWLARNTSWSRARSRYVGCMLKENHYDTDRLVAAANMFDILPESAVPIVKELDASLAQTRSDCLKLLRAHPPGSERDSAIMAISRIGRPSLRKKIAHRAASIEAKFGHKAHDLQWVATIAVKMRNFFVHGASDDFDHEAAEPMLPFLTDALEFIFGASDLLEAGWDPSPWLTAPTAGTHSFARFILNYKAELNELRGALRAKRG